MRADRLLMLIMVLQTRGKMTTRALARELGVSRRTILRDVDALSLSGVPIYSEGGHGGGVALDERYRTTLTGLQTPEVRSLFVTAAGEALGDVGLGEASERLVLKLLAALPAMHRPAVDHIRGRLLIDPAWWWRDAETPEFWDELQKAVYEDRLIEVTYERYEGTVAERILEPYSLVYKSGLWYLVGQRESEMRTYRVSRLRRVRLLDQPFARRADFDLPAYWAEHQQEFIESFSAYRCLLKIHPDRVTFVRWLVPGRWEILGEPDGRGWVTLQLMMDSALLARMLVFGLGDHCEVLAPPELAGEVLAAAREAVARLGG